jgi:hypothetical protein
MPIARRIRSLPMLYRSLERPFLVLCVLLVTCAGCTHRRVSLVVDPSVRLEERRERSVTEDPAVKGETPDGWLVPPAENAAAQQAPAKTAAGLQERSEDPKGSEIAEFVERFKNTKPPKIFQGELPPGASRAVDMQLTGPSGLAGSAQWIGTAAAMKVTIAVNASPLATGTAYRLGSNRGGCYLKVQTPIGGRATMAVTNTSNASVKVRIMLVATTL